MGLLKRIDLALSTAIRVQRPRGVNDRRLGEWAQTQWRKGGISLNISTVLVIGLLRLFVFHAIQKRRLYFVSVLEKF